MKLRMKDLWTESGAMVEEDLRVRFTVKFFCISYYPHTGNKYVPIIRSITGRECGNFSFATYHKNNFIQSATRGRKEKLNIVRQSINNH